MYEVDDLIWIGTASNIDETYARSRCSNQFEKLLDLQNFDQSIAVGTVREAQASFVRDRVQKYDERDRSNGVNKGTIFKRGTDGRKSVSASHIIKFIF